jgi:cell pole-organizing protein PopZ
LVGEIMRPMLKSWLDNNLRTLVERALYASKLSAYRRRDA